MAQEYETRISEPSSYQVGDVVTLDDRIELMTVEATRTTSFGLSLSCCWFDGDDALHFDEYPSNRLDLFPRPDCRPFIETGTEVRLRSNGPVMTVRSIESSGQGHYALCEWTGPMGATRRRRFPLSALSLTLLGWNEKLTVEVRG